MRTDISLKQHYRAILSYTGLIFLLAGALILTPLLILIGWPREYIYATGFIYPAAVLALIGVTMWKIFRLSKPIILNIQEGGVIVLFSWVMVCLFCALPYMLVQKLTFAQAIFESVSGWTTTGLSMIDVTKASHLVLIWRSITQIAGGAGLAIISLAAIAGPKGPGFSLAEGRTDQLVPHVRQSAKLVISIYSGYLIVGTLAYWLAGMDLFDAINHSFAALSTGGFSTHPESIAHWDSVAIETVSIVLMILGNMNFLTGYLIITSKFKAVYRNSEVRLMTFLIPVSFIILLLLVIQGIFTVIGKSLRVAIFEPVSALTTTGFSTTSYNNWNAVGWMVLIVLMLIGGGTCSTAGGIKQYRIYLLYKFLIWEIRRSLLPRTTIIENYVWQGEQKDYIKADRISQIANFLFLYLVTYVIGTIILAAHGFGLQESLFEFASALSNSGLSVGVTSSDAPISLIWTETIGMFLGRLEIFVIFISIGKIIRDSVIILRGE